MRVLIVYDSVYGNTQKIAEAIGSGIAGEVKAVKASDANLTALSSTDLLIVGSPTQGGRPTKPVQDFITGISESAIKGLKVASFDTRYAGRFVKVFGFAAERIAQSLKAKGGTMTAPPEAFFVTGKQGPLKEGELERAMRWGGEIAK